MHLHFLGICGTFMGSLAILAQEMGFKVSGSDRNIYPPMSEQLQQAGISLHQGFDYDPASLKPDLVIVGNVMRRGLPCVEALLESNLPYTSGPQWLHDFLLKPQPYAVNSGQKTPEPRWVLAVAGTHGKTTTSSMLAWILEVAGLNPGFLIGGVPANFGISARLGASNFFVLEADEYDTAFFDKRSKFVHYTPRTLVLNNLEFDHADIFPNLAAIQTQFQHLLRLVPAKSGAIIRPASCENLNQVLEQGCWSASQTFGVQNINQPAAADWQAQELSAGGSSFEVSYLGKKIGTVNWELSGQHNIENALAALGAAVHVGVQPQVALEALCSFKNVKRRMELVGSPNKIQVYDDFAHHPTAIATTLEGAKPKCAGRLIAVLEPRSNTMQLGSLKAQLPASLAAADAVFWYQNPQMRWSPSELNLGTNFTCLDELINALVAFAQPEDWLVIMSNGSFGGLHQKLVAALNK